MKLRTQTLTLMATALLLGLSPAPVSARPADTPGMASTLVSEATVSDAGTRVVKKVIPRRINWHDLDIDLFPRVGASVRQVTIAENPAYLHHPARDWTHFYEADSVTMHFDLLALLFGRIHIADMDVRDYRFHVLLDKGFKTNVSDLMQNSNSLLMKHLRVDRLTASNGQLHFVDMTTPNGKTALTFDQIDARLNDFSMDRTFGIDISVRTPEAERRNVTLQGIAGPVSQAKRMEQVPLRGRLHVQDAPIMPFKAYFPKGLRAYPEQGLASLKTELDGNLWDGLDASGALALRQLVLADQDGRVRGKPFDLDIQFAHSQLALKDDQLTINDTRLSLAGALFTIKGKVLRLLNNPSVDMSLKGMIPDLAVFETLYPFLREYFPDDLHYGGKVQLDASARGDMSKLASSGSVDASGMWAGITGLFEKKAGDSALIQYNATLLPEDFSIDAHASVQINNIRLLNPGLFAQGLALVAPEISPQALAIIHSASAMKAGNINGKVRYRNGKVSFDKMAINDIRDDRGDLMDVEAGGWIDIESGKMSVQVNAILSAERSRQLTQHSHRIALSEDGRFHYRFSLTGKLAAPQVLALQTDAGQKAVSSPEIG